MQVENVRFRASDGVELEGRLALPNEGARGGAVVCHPHPQHGGTMSSALVPAIWRALCARGYASLRFDFRGVGRSQGSFTNGPGETQDALAALDRVAAAAPPGAPLVIAGWSFGSLVALNAGVRDARVVAYAGVAPPVRMTVSIELPPLPPAEELAAWRARAMFACGTDDPFCSPKALERWIAEHSIRAEVRVFEGEDHFFTNGRADLAAAVGDFLTQPEAAVS
jgi:alpha/beta superfamily hydrolase